MLGKLIKNEFVHRGRDILALYSGLIISGIIVRILDVIKNTFIFNDTFNIICYIIYILFLVVVPISALYVVVLAVQDWGKRIFKDQGYLTLTLPVKSSTMIMARMVCDVATIISYAIVFPLVMSIAIGDFGFYEEVLDVIVTLAKYSGTGLEKATIFALLISIIILFLLGVLFEMWHFYTAYALGHMFNKEKRVLSIVFYIIIFIILTIISVVLSDMLENNRAFMKFIYNYAESNNNDVGAVLLVITIFNLLFIGLTAVLATICNYICKKKVNLE